MSNISPELIAQFDQARAAGKTLAETEPRAVKAGYATDSKRVFIELTNGAMMGFPFIVYAAAPAVGAIAS